MILPKLLPNRVYYQCYLIVIDERRHVVLVEVRLPVIRHEMVRAHRYRRGVHLLLPQKQQRSKIANISAVSVTLVRVLRNRLARL